MYRVTYVHVYTNVTVCVQPVDIVPPTFVPSVPSSCTHMRTQHHIAVVHHFTGRFTKKQCEVTVYIDGRQIWKNTSLEAPAVTEVSDIPTKPLTSVWMHTQLHNSTCVHTYSMYTCTCAVFWVCCAKSYIPCIKSYINHS